MAVCNYEVFLSFRGPDTRKIFIRHFKEQLREWGITKFLDSDEIEYGERIDEKIMAAIEHSDICIPVFSKDFATSRPCLMEVAQMVKSKKKICPIFFDIEPCDVRYQRGTYKESFDKHELNNRYPDSIETWKTALKEASEVNGPVIKNDYSGYPEMMNFIIQLSIFLREINQDVAKGLVGIDNYVSEMMRKLGFTNRDGRVVEVMEGRWVLTVWGPSGIGKTTLAWVLYKKISHLFQCCSFLENVPDEIKRNGVVSLQNRLICELRRERSCPLVPNSYDGARMIQQLFRESRVLIILDNVDDKKQIELLAELTWFGQRSRIILTTTTKDVYKVGKPEDPYLYQPNHEILPMEKHHALELFRKRACRPNPSQKYEKMSEEIVSAVDCLPFAIDFVGKSLHGASETEWERTLGYLNVKPKDKVKKLLKSKYKHLSDEAKQVFLDIACFFTEVEKTIPGYMWAARGLDGGVEELQKNSFLKIGDNNEFRLHGQLKLLGRETVKKENPDNPGKRSRVWDYKDFKTILPDNTGTSKVKWQGTGKVKALRVASEFNQVDGEVFRNLSNLRFLELDKVDIEGNTVDLLPELVWLDWRGCPKKSRECPKNSKLFVFHMKELVILNLCSRPDKLTLEDWEQLMEKTQSLEVLKLKDCIWINASLEIPASSHLKCLILEDCLHLKLDTTNFNFENLVSFNMKHCERVTHLPQALCSMKVLKELLIDGTDIAKLQFEEGSLPALEILSACGCKQLREVTDSIGFLEKLRKLILRHCKQLTTLPHVFGKLALLQEMDLSHTSIDELPHCVKECNKLEVLKMVRTSLNGFPEAIKNLRELKELDFTLCGGLSGQRCDITGLFSLRILRLTRTKISEVLARDEVQFCLHVLELDPDVTWQTPAS